MSREKGILIPAKLFNDLIRYHIAGFTDAGEDIEKALIAKVDRMENHKLYTQAKISPDDKEKEASRQKYLDKKGVPEEYRW